MQPLQSPRIIKGRNVWSDRALTRVTISKPVEGKAFLAIEGASLQTSQTGAFVLSAKHVTGTDEEHDSGYIAYFEGFGLTWQSMIGSRMEFMGAIIQAAFYTDEDYPTQMCEGGEDCPRGGPHPIVAFTPPVRKFWEPAAYVINVEYDWEGREK